MKKYVWMFFAVALLAVISYVVFVREQGEFKSPRKAHVFNDNDLKVELGYGSPAKRGRKIFGGLVSFDTVWRTGANEATEFHTNKDLDFNGQALKAGEYSVWVLPSEANWQIFINSHIPDWGINQDGIAARLAENDVVKVEAPVGNSDKMIENFAMTVEKTDSVYNLVFVWDMTKVVVPFTGK